MGAVNFETISSGNTAEEAFASAVDQARYFHGHGGYTGSVAEKSSFVMIDVPKGKDPMQYADDLLMNDDPRVSDKWGPAGCIKLDDGRYYFFGMASS